MEKMIKWETLKRKAKYEFDGKIHCCGGFPTKATFEVIIPALLSGATPRALLEDWYKKALEYIDRWDIRMCKQLIECFPKIVNGHFNKIEAGTNEKMSGLLF
jgi:hypothetical protein